MFLKVRVGLEKLFCKNFLFMTNMTWLLYSKFVAEEWRSMSQIELYAWKWNVFKHTRAWNLLIKFFKWGREKGHVNMCWGFHNILDQIKPKTGLICSTKLWPSNSNLPVVIARLKYARVGKTYPYFSLELPATFWRRNTYFDILFLGYFVISFPNICLEIKWTKAN